MKRLNHHLGFSLVELMVSITIVLVLSSSALAAYYQFSQRQETLNDTRNFVTFLQRVQARARNLVYPPGCTGLIGYRVFVNCGASCKNINASAVCSSGDVVYVADQKVLETVNFPAVDVTFLAGSGAISSPVQYVFTNANETYESLVEIDQNGIITFAENE